MAQIRKNLRISISLIFGIFILWVTFHHADIRLFYHNLKELNWLWVTLSFLCAMASYICIAGVLQSLLTALHYYLKPVDVFNIALVSTVANYALNIGGISGLAIKIYLLSRRKILPSHTLSLSLIHGFFTNTIAVFFIFAGFTVFYSHYSFGMAKKDILIWIAWVVIAALMATFIWMGFFIVNASVRFATLNFLMRLYHRVSTRIKLLARKAELLESTFENFNKSMDLVVKNIRQILYASLYALADWIFMFACLKTSFLAVHCPAKLGILAIGFCVSLFTSIIAIIPGGLGIMEGSMVSIFYLLGLEYEKSLVAVLIYRVLYYLVPMIIGGLIFLSELSNFRKSG